MLDINATTIRLETAHGALWPVRDVSLTLERGKILGLVGESGSGKSLSCLACMGLLPRPLWQVSGSIRFEGRELVGLEEREWRKIRGSQIAMIFQDPSSCLNPVHTIGAQILEAVRFARPCTRHEAEQQALALLQRVGIAEPRQRLSQYPHQLSGGMNQRVMIAMALAGKPRLLLADEPTTALDVTIQAQILDLLLDLVAEDGLSIILVSHDLGVIAQTADAAAVMYAGRIVEKAPVATLFSRPHHPYTQALLEASPRADRTVTRLNAIPGTAAPLHAAITGCSFADRCPQATQECRAEIPPLIDAQRGHTCACIHGSANARSHHWQELPFSTPIVPPPLPQGGFEKVVSLSSGYR